MKKYSDLTEEQKEKRRASCRAWQNRNKEKVKATKKAYNQSDIGKAAKKRWEENYKKSGGRKAAEERRKNKPISKARLACRKKWAKSDEGKAYHAGNRSKRRAKSDLTELDLFVLKEAHRLAKLREKLLDSKWEVDHIVAITKGGTNHYDNIQVVPALWNRRKSNIHANKFFSANKEN
jgi:hypothetical protein